MCQVWNVQWSSSEALAKQAAGVMAAGEHRYEDSYFMKHGRDNNDVKSQESQAKRFKTNGTSNHETSSKESSNSSFVENGSLTTNNNDIHVENGVSTMSKDKVTSNDKQSSFGCKIQ